MTVALYARVSTEGQDPEVQLMALRAHATQRGWQVVEEFVDRGVSGAKERRPALDRLMKAAWTGQFQAVLVALRPLRPVGQAPGRGPRDVPPSAC